MLWTDTRKVFAQFYVDVRADETVLFRAVGSVGVYPEKLRYGGLFVVCERRQRPSRHSENVEVVVFKRNPQLGQDIVVKKVYVEVDVVSHNYVVAEKICKVRQRRQELSAALRHCVGNARKPGDEGRYL